jgi:hypothetical protein
MNDKITELESRNSELAKEILLNESAIYEALSELNHVDPDIINHEKIRRYFKHVELLIERLEAKNYLYKKEIYQNDLEIKRLKGNEE